MPKLVIIEDDKFISEILKELLTVHGYDVHMAVNGWIGLEVTREQMPDLVLCDIMMRPITGLEVLAHMKAETALAKIPLIFLSARAQASDREQAMQLGAVDYIVKPFKVEELLETIHRHLSKTPLH